MMITNIDLLGFTCSHPRVRQFCQAELLNFPTHPYVPPPMSGPQLFRAARDRFGDYACIDLEFWLH